MNEPSESNPIQSIPKKLATKLKQAPANRGKTAETLYKEFARTLITSTLGTYKGSIASWIINKFIRPGAIVENLVQTVAGSMKDNKGYSHALNTFLLTQLNQVKALLIANAQKSSPPIPISKDKEKELTKIIQQILELYHKSECATIDELRTVVNRTKTYSELETKLIPSLMETLALQISQLLEFHVNTNQIDELTLKLLSLTNDSFKPMKVVNDLEMKATENTIKYTIDEIVEMFLDKAIRENVKVHQRHVVALIKQIIAKPLVNWWTNISISEMKNQIGIIKDGLVKVATERTTYLCALNHLLLIPHVEAMKNR